VSQAALPRCDCLNECGDDQDVRNGKAQPCAYRLSLLAKKAQESADVEAVQQLIVRLQNSSDQPEQELAGALARIVNSRQWWSV